MPPSIPVHILALEHTHIHVFPLPPSPPSSHPAYPHVPSPPPHHPLRDQVDARHRPPYFLARTKGVRDAFRRARGADGLEGRWAWDAAGVPPALTEEAERLAKEKVQGRLFVCRTYLGPCLGPYLGPYLGPI